MGAERNDYEESPADCPLVNSETGLRSLKDEAPLALRPR